jgi:hypothetical protein
MKITNEIVGKWILLGINSSCILALSAVGVRKLNNNYKVREDKFAYYVNSLWYSFVLILVSIFTVVPTIYNKHVLGNIFNDNLSEGLPWFYLLIFGIIVIIIAINVYDKIIKAKYHLQLKYSFLLFTISIIFWYNRCFTDNYEFYPLSVNYNISWLKILDLPFFIYTVIVILLLFHSLFVNSKKCKYSSTLVADSPLEDAEYDQYKRTQVYQSFIYSIRNNKFSKSRALSIGLVNKWGEGKTSFLNFLKKDLKSHEDTIIVDFNPWYSTNANNVTYDFFQTLDAELSKYIYTGSLLRKYAKSLTNLNSVYNPFKYLPGSLVDEKSNKEYFNSINALICKVNKRIIIIVDDLDRLDNKEVFNVFQVIRNSADFSNTIFVTPFDKEYVLNSLIENKIHKPIEYLKKIFDVELTLPPISQEFLRLIAYELLLDAVKDTSQALGEKQSNLNSFEQQIERIFDGSMLSRVEKYQVIQSVILNKLINKRELNRFCNSLKISIQTIKDFVYLPDFLILELIKYLDIEVYRNLMENDNYWVSIPSMKQTGVDKKGLYNLRMRFNLKSVDDQLKISKKHFDILESENVKNNDTIKKLIKALFLEPATNEFQEKFAFCYINNFIHYHRLEFNRIEYALPDENL